MIETAAAGADHEQPAWRERGRRIEGEFEIGGVLRGRMPLDPRAVRLCSSEPLRRDGVEVPDRDVDSQSQRARSIDTAVGRDHGRRRRKGDPQPLG